MSDAPLRPFSLPAFIESGLYGSGDWSNLFSARDVVTLVFSMMLALWAVYTLVAIYHWLKYSHASVIAIPAIVVHLGVSLALVSYALSGTFFL